MLLCYPGANAVIITREHIGRRVYPKASDIPAVQAIYRLILNPIRGLTQQKTQNPNPGYSLPKASDPGPQSHETETHPQVML